jgi:hypothetical protein
MKLLFFENVNTVGIGGGFVSATLVVSSTDTDTTIECRGLEVTLIGKVSCQFTADKVSVRGAAELFKHQLVLIPRVEDATSPGVSIPHGRQEHPFCFALPDCIPTSLTTQFGAIEYVLKASFESKKLKNPSTTLTLDVRGSRSPRLEAAFQAPRVAAQEKRFFMSPRLCRATLQVDNPIGHVGSVLRGTVVVDNASHKTVGSIGIKLLQVATWYASGRTNLVLATAKAAKQVLPDSKVLPKSNRTIAFQLTIPASAHRPSVLDGTDCVVSLQHFVCATVNVAFAAKFEVRVPFFFTPTPSELQLPSEKPAITPIAPVSVNPSVIAAMVNDGLEATLQVSAPVPVVVSRVGKRKERELPTEKV